MIIIKTIADFKRAMQVGTKVDAKLYHKVGELLVIQKVWSTRPVSIHQSNSFALTTVKEDGTTANSWCDWPKKDEFKVLENGDIQITRSRIVLVYTILPTINLNDGAAGWKTYADTYE